MLITEKFCYSYKCYLQAKQNIKINSTCIIKQHLHYTIIFSHVIEIRQTYWHLPSAGLGLLDCSGGSNNGTDICIAV